MPIVKIDSNYITHNLICPQGSSKIELCCSEIKGFYVLVSAQSEGQGTYYLRYKDTNGKTCHKKIGRTTDISLVDARRQAKILKAEIALGANPQAQKKAQREELTYADFFENLYLPYVKPRKRSWKRDEELYRLRIKAELGDKKLSAITRAQIQTFHTALLEEGLAPATCNHHVKLIKHSLNLAIDWGMLEKNACSRIPLLPENNIRNDYLSEEELERLLTVLNADENKTVCRIALLLLSSGCRVSEILSAKFSDINLEKRIFIVRATNSKSRKPRTVVLNDSCVEIINQLDRDSEYLFINKQTKKPYTTISKVFDRLRKKAGLPHLRIHSLRHNFASALINNNISLAIVQQLLGHSDPKITLRYTHLSSKTLQDAANNASLIIKGTKQQEVESVAELVQ